MVNWLGKLNMPARSRSARSASVVIVDPVIDRHSRSLKPNPDQIVTLRGDNLTGHNLARHEILAGHVDLLRPLREHRRNCALRRRSLRVKYSGRSKRPAAGLLAEHSTRRRFPAGPPSTGRGGPILRSSDSWPSSSAAGVPGSLQKAKAPSRSNRRRLTKSSSSSNCSSVSPGKPVISVVRNTRRIDPAAKPIEQPFGFLAPDPPPHPLQHLVADVLKRNVQVRQYLFARRDDPDQFVGDVGRVKVHQPNPGQALDCFQASEEFGQQWPAVQVQAVERGVLGDQHQLPNAVGGQLLGLGHHLVDRLARIRAAHLRNRTKTAQTIAPLGDLQVRQMWQRES